MVDRTLSLFVSVLRPPWLADPFLPAFVTRIAFVTPTAFVAHTAFVTHASQTQGKSGEKTVQQNKMSQQTLPIRQYLDATVVPLLLQGMSAMVKERCARP